MAHDAAASTPAYAFARGSSGRERFSEEAAPSTPRAAALTEQAATAFEEHFGPSDEARPVCGARAPGRVNLLGGHTDYSGGFVLPATIDRTVCVLLRRRDDERVRLRSADFGETASYDLSNAFDAERLPGWARYVGGVAEELRQIAGRTAVSGFEGIICGDVPLGAGLSSSAALEVAAAVALGTLFALGTGPVETAKLCQRAEQKHAGVDCGILDQFAARLGQSGKALFLDCRSLEFEHVPLPSDTAQIVILDSRVSRELADSKYNERRRECEEAARFYARFDESIASLRDVSEALIEKHGSALDGTLQRRARHVVSENRRTREGARALRDGRLEAFGDLMNASHASLSADYEVSSAELDLLAKVAQATKGVFGARMTGAGFGGCVVALAAPEALEALRRRAIRAYHDQFDRTPDVYAVPCGEEAIGLGACGQAEQR